MAQASKTIRYEVTVTDELRRLRTLVRTGAGPSIPDTVSTETPGEPACQDQAGNEVAVETVEEIPREEHSGASEASSGPARPVDGNGVSLRPDIWEPRRERGPFRGISLRRDGRRPLRFRGTCIVSFDAGNTKASKAGGSSRIALYLTDARNVVAQVTIEPPEGWPIGSVNRAGPVADAEDFARFLRSSAPLETLGGLVVNGHALRDEHSADVAELEGGFRTLAAAIARANLNECGNEQWH